MPCMIFDAENCVVDVGLNLLTGLYAVNEALDLVQEHISAVELRLFGDEGLRCNLVFREAAAVNETDAAFGSDEVDVVLFGLDVLRPCALEGDDRSLGLLRRKPLRCRLHRRFRSRCGSPRTTFRGRGSWECRSRASRTLCRIPREAEDRRGNTLQGRCGELPSRMSTPPPEIALVVNAPPDSGDGSDWQRKFTNTWYTSPSSPLMMRRRTSFTEGGEAVDDTDVQNLSGLVLSLLHSRAPRSKCVPRASRRERAFRRAERRLRSSCA